MLDTERAVSRCCFFREETSAVRWDTSSFNSAVSDFYSVNRSVSVSNFWLTPTACAAWPPTLMYGSYGVVTWGGTGDAPGRESGLTQFPEAAESMDKREGSSQECWTKKRSLENTTGEKRRIRISRKTQKRAAECSMKLHPTLCKVH